MTNRQPIPLDAVLVAIDIAKVRNEVLAHLHSSMVTMSQKSSVIQPAKSDDVDGLSSTHQSAKAWSRGAPQ